jgi:hypothetical protein
MKVVRLRLPILVVAVVVVLTATAFAENHIVSLTNEEANLVVGSGCLCKVLSTSCYQYVVNCAIPGLACSTACTMGGLQDAACRWYLYGTGCTIMPARSCGTQQVGFCDGDNNCVYFGTVSCGLVAHCI